LHEVIIKKKKGANTAVLTPFTSSEREI